MKNLLKGMNPLVSVMNEKNRGYNNKKTGIRILRPVPKPTTVTLYISESLSIVYYSKGATKMNGKEWLFNGFCCTYPGLL